MSKEEKILQKQKTKFRRKKIFEYIIRLKGLLIISIILTIIASILQTAVPFIISKILDTQLVEGTGAIDRSSFYKLVALYVLAISLTAFIRYVSSISFALLSNKLANIIRIEVFNHVLKLPVKFFDSYASGKIVSRISNDTKDIRSYLNILFLEILPNIVLFISLLSGIFIVDYKLGLITLIGFPFAWIIFKDYFLKSTRYQRDHRKYKSDLNANLAETIQTMEIVTSFNKENEIFEEFSEVNDRVFGEGKNLTKIWSYSAFNATNTLGNIILALIIYIFGITFFEGNPIVTVGGLFIFIDYNRSIYMRLNWFMNNITNLEKAKSAADQVFELLTEKPYKEGNIVLEKIEGHIVFEDVTFAYNGDEYVLKNINLDIKPNESVAFVGHTGSGKSTIMNLIYGFYRINKGSLKIDGVEISQLNMEEVRKEMAIVFQNPYIFEGSVYDNISLFDTNITKERCIEALRDVGGRKILDRINGIDAEVGEGGTGFSSGERQLISFARAMVRNPKILVLDEATANVDSETEEYIQYGVAQLKKGRTTMVIAHRLSTIKDVDKIYVLENGHIIESGNHDELIALKGVYEKMYMES